MKVISVNVGLPHEVVWKSVTVQTAIFKEPVTGKVAIRELNLAGDQQADLTVHGGLDKAVYAYPAEHYDYWQKQLPGVSFHGAHLVRTSRPRGYGKTHFALGSSRGRVCRFSGYPAAHAVLQASTQVQP